MNYCSHCGASVTRKIPLGDNLPRHVCDRCDQIHYHNPKIVAGCIPEWEDQILLCRRAIELRLGLWTFPAGFMELGESTEHAAIRETQEEIGVTPLEIEFWQGRENRLHDRFLYTRQDDDHWRIDRLAP